MSSNKNNFSRSTYYLHAIANAFVALVWTAIVAVGESTQSSYSSIIPIAFFIASMVFILLELFNRQNKNLNS